MNHHHAVLLSVLICIPIVGCTTTKPVQKIERKVVEEEPKDKITPKIVKAATFCPEGAQDYKRSKYRWCKKDDTIHGRFQVMDEAGQVALEGQFEQGKMTGKWTRYWPNKTKRWQVVYANNKETGSVQGWYKEGKPHYALSYKDGRRHGTSTYWYKDGQKSTELNFSEGKPMGDWTYWYGNGKKSHAFQWQAKGKETIHKHWTKRGKKTQSPNGRLSKSKVTPAIDGLATEVVDCYRHARLISPTQGKLVAQFSIDYSGDVSLMSLIESDFSHPFMGQCARRHLEGLRFPENPYGRMAIIRSWQLSVQ